MKTTMRSSIVAALVALVVAAIVPIAPAAAAPVGEPEATQADGPSSLALRRDPRESVAFVADLSPQASNAAGGTNGFDWGAAALGAGATFLTLGAGAVLVIRRRTGLSPSASMG